MDSIKIDKKSAQIIAHRGLCALETENTAAAFVAAGNRSYYGIETDIRKTADGQYVAFHDGDYKRLANLDISVEGSTYEELQKICFNDYVTGQRRTDLRTPLLSEYIYICKKYDKEAVLELKTTFSESDILEIIDIIVGLDYLHKTTFIAFDVENLKIVRKHYKDQKAQLLAAEINEQIMGFLQDYNLDIDVHYKALTSENVRILKQYNKKINCWTCDDKDIANTLIDLGVDYITSNILE